MSQPETGQGNQPAPAPPPSGVRPGRPWVYPAMGLVVFFSLLGSALFVFKSCRDLPGETLRGAGKVVTQAGHQLANLAAAFKQGTVTTSFTSYATTLSGNQYLQFATLSQVEIFTRKDEASLAFGYVPLPDIIVEATAPVTYTYYLDLNERWDFLLKDGVLQVIAPDIKFNKPAVDASRITYEVKKNSLIRNTTDAQEHLKESITLLSYQKAKANIGLVRETGRHQTEVFVQNWLARSFSDGKQYPVKVRFRHETGAPEGGVILPVPDQPSHPAK